jgi:predicted dehydrogenase
MRKVSGKMKKVKEQKGSRRKFLAAAGGAAAAAALVPRYVLGGREFTAPSDLLNIAMIGTGGQGMQNLRNLLRQDDLRVMALADVTEWADYSHTYHRVPGGRKPGFNMIKDYYSSRPTTEDYPDCGVYIDFRKMLDKEKDIDAVVVSTPDHTHYIAAMAAIAYRKHLYVEKPLCRTIYEVRKLTEAARRAGIVTQMGNQGHGDEGLRLTYEWIRDGAIGQVYEVHAWSAGGQSEGCPGHKPEGRPPIPEGFDWDLWLGPIKKRPYHPDYTEGRWRDWWAFGTGRIGDFGCHNMDPAFFALDLGYPEWVQARSAWGDRDKRPFASIIYYKFPARGEMPPLKLTWYTGLMPPRPEELEPGRELAGDGQGILFIGEKGKIMCPGWAGNPRLIPEEKMQAYREQLPPKTLKRVGGIYRDWIDAIKTGGQASSNFDYSGPMTEVILMGIVAMLTEEKLYWDGPNMKANNCSDADEYIKPEYHNGWEL